MVETRNGARRTLMEGGNVFVIVESGYEAHYE